MRQFPIILIPPTVQRIAQSKPDAPAAPSKLPIAPSQSPQPIETQEAILLTIGLIFVVAIVTLIVKELGIVLLIVGTIAIIFKVRYQFQTYESRYQKYQASLQGYLLQLENYSREELKYQQKLAIAYAPELVLTFRQQQYKKIFAKLVLTNQGTAINELDDSVHRAANAAQFGNMLQKYLSGNLYQNANLLIPSIDYEWSPALIYRDPELNCHIAIEIVPSIETKQAIAQNDLAERFLVNNNWIIIKYAEAQIQHKTLECCKEFAKLLDRLSFDPRPIDQLADVADLNFLRS
jgi:type II secretory pathway pseudopilin PulG